MTIVSAFLVPGSPLPQLKRDALPWGRLAAACERAGRALAASRPDAVLVYSTQWFAVLDQQWLTRPRSTGVHVDENWYELGEQPFDLFADTELAHACVAGCARVGVHARGVNYDGFPIDSGMIAAATLMEFGTAQRPIVAGSNNLYHDAATTERLAAVAVTYAKEQGKRLAVVGIGNLSGGSLRTGIDPHADRISSPEHDRWNQRLLRILESGNTGELRALLPDYIGNVRPDMGMKHLHWILGALQGRFTGGRVHGYGPLHGAGGAVVEFSVS
jgi:2-aminophenol/2-amino-5-chlorophenol 1,6-dioxygenase alpha subunit